MSPGKATKKTEKVGKIPGPLVQLTNVNLRFVVTNTDVGPANGTLITEAQIAEWVGHANDVFHRAGVKCVVEDVVTVEDPDLDNDYTIPFSYDPNDHTDETKPPWDEDPELKAALDQSAVEHVVIRDNFAEENTPGFGLLNLHFVHFVFFRRGNLIQWDGAKWSVGRLWGGYSGLDLQQVNMQNFMDHRHTLLAHELGHYFGLPHTFWEDALPRADDFTEKLGDSESADEYRAAVAAVIRAGVLGTDNMLWPGETAFSREDGARIFDVDRRLNVAKDTPADINPGWFWKPVFGEAAVMDETNPLESTVTVDFGDEMRDYTLAPDRNNVMGYYIGSGGLARKLSNDQAKFVRSNLDKRFRGVVDELGDLLVRSEVPPDDPVELDVTVLEVDELRNVVAEKVGRARVDRVLRTAAQRGGRIVVSKSVMQRVKRARQVARRRITGKDIPRPCGPAIAG